jgi:eukaryotic-like serine/threonine-protein kinase
MPLPAGTRLGACEVLSPLGAGGMGEVYRARDARLERDVAIKVLPPSLADDPAALARFEREAKSVAQLSHPNIMGIFDFGHEPPGPRGGRAVTYAVMELLEGGRCATAWRAARSARERRSTTPSRWRTDLPRRTARASSTAT